MIRPLATIDAVEAMLDEAWLDLDDLCRAAGVSATWVQQHVVEGCIVARPGASAGAWRFDAAALRRVRCIAQLERDFDAVPELAALGADLQDELARLRARLHALGEQ